MAHREEVAVRRARLSEGGGALQFTILFQGRAVPFHARHARRLAPVVAARRLGRATLGVPVRPVPPLALLVRARVRVGLGLG